MNISGKRERKGGREEERKEGKQEDRKEGQLMATEILSPSLNSFFKLWNIFFLNPSFLFYCILFPPPLLIQDNNLHSLLKK